MVYLLKDFELQNTRMKNVVKAKVHNNSIGEAGTREWTEKLLMDLNFQFNATKIHFDNGIDPVNENELGTLLSAAGLTIRYAVETLIVREYLEQYQAIFVQILQIPHWSKAYLGLKMVALRGCTRLLESFEEANSSLTEIVLPWTIEVLKQCQQDELTTQLLFRTVCEFLNVLLQIQPNIAKSILIKHFPVIVELHTKKFSSNHLQDITEWMTLIYVVLDNIFPPLPSARQLMSYSPEAIKPSSINLTAALPVNEWQSLVSALTSCSMNGSIATVMPSLYKLAYMEYPPSIAQDSFNAFLQYILSSIDELPWDHPSHMELGQSFVESLRDLLLTAYSNNVHYIKLDAYSTLEALVLRLPMLSKDRMFKSVKSMLPGLRDTVVEAFTALMYCLGPKFWEVQEAFTKSLALKLADPLVFGDMLYVLRPASDFVDTKTYQNVVDMVVNTLIKSLHQLPRYSKPLAKKILESVNHTAQGAGNYVGSHVENIASLLTEVTDECPSSLKSNIISALTRLYLISPFQNQDTIEIYCDMLGTAVLHLKTTALEEMLLLLQHNVATVKWLLSTLPSKFWTSFLETCTTSLTSFPVFEEDMPLVLAQINICRLLVPHQSGMTDWNRTTLKPLLAQFITQMEEDDMIELAEAARALESTIKA